MKYCIKCGEKVNDDAQFCPGCGAKIPEGTEEKKCEGCCYAKGHPCVSAVCYKELDAWLRAIRANRAKEAGAANE